MLDDGQSLLLHEHVLGAAQADALSAECDRALGIARVVGVGPDAERARLVGPAEQCPQIVLFLEVRFDGGDSALVDRAGRAVDGDLVAFFDDHARCRGSRTGAVVVHADRLAADHRRQAEAARHYRRVAARAAATREDALRHEHAVDVVGAGLLAHEDDRARQLCLPPRRDRRRRSLCRPPRLERHSHRAPAHVRALAHCDVVIVEARQQQLDHLRRLDALDGLLLR